MSWYAVYHRGEDGKHNEIAVKFGFSYTAFLFTWIWALTKRLYIVAFLSFLLGPITPMSIVFYILSAIPPPLWVTTGSKSLASFALNALPWVLAWSVQTYLGFNGNRMYRRKLEKINYSYLMTVCHRRNITRCYKPMLFNRMCFLIKNTNYSGLIPGALLSMAALWLSIHNLLPIR